MTLPPDVTTMTVDRGAPARSRPLVIFWAGTVLAIAGFIVLGSIPVGAGNWIGRRLPVREIWSRFLGYLTDQGASQALVAFVAAAAVVSLIAAAVGLGLAIGLRDDSIESPADESVGM